MINNKSLKHLSEIFYRYKTSQSRQVVVYATLAIFSFILMLFCTKSSPLFAFNDWFDANIYFTMGKGLMNGRIPYVDLIDNKGPLLYLIYGIAWMIDHTGFFGVYLFQSVFVTVSVIFTYRLSLLFIKSRQIAFVAAVCSPMPMLFNRFYAAGYDFGGGGPDEICRALMIVSLFYFTLYYTKPEDYKPRHTFMQGCLFMCVFLIKFNLVVFWTGFLISIFCELVYKKKFDFLLKHVTRFLLGVFITDLPYLIYGIVTKSLKSFWNTYFLYNSLYVNPNSNPVLKAVRSLLSAIRTIGGLDLLGFCLLFSIGFVFVFFVCKTGFKVGYSISLLILFTVTYFTMMRFATIHITFTISLIFGIVALGVFVDQYAKQSKFSLIKTFTATVLVMIVTIGINKLVKYEFFLTENQTAQQEMAEVLWQRTRNESPTLLEINSLDSGFYTAAGIIPEEPFFFVYNINHADYPYPRDAQRKAVTEGHSEFVITNTYENISLNPYNIRRLYNEIYVLQGTGYQCNIFYRLFQLKPHTSFDENFSSKLIGVESNTNYSPEALAAIYDNDDTTQWITGGALQSGDYLIFEFNENVTYNTIYMAVDGYYDCPITLSTSVSTDGKEWQEAPLIFIDNFGNVRFEDSVYRYLKLTANDSAQECWIIAEIYFGYTKGDAN